MRRVLLASGCLIALAAAAPGHATVVTDPTGDFIDSFVGTEDPDLDVTSFLVGYDTVTEVFRLRGTVAGDIDPSKAGLYVIGVNTGAGVSPGPFAGIGAPNVVFNRVVIVQKTGLATISGTPVTAHVFGNVFTVEAPLALLASTGFAPLDYRWNLWPRNGLGNNNQISDFAPDDSTITASVPEPATWALLIGGFGLAGGALRRRTHRTALPV